VNGLYQVRSGLAFQNVCRYTGSKAGQNEPFIGVHGKEDGFCSRTSPEHLAGGVYAVQEGHPNIQHSNVRLQFFAQPYGVEPIRSLTYDIESFFREDRSQSISDDLMIVGKQ
jgi:hypothetical protein